MSKKAPSRQWIAGLFFWGFLIYLPSFRAPFQLDDYSSIVDNPLIKNLHLIRYLWESDPSRFLTNVSFALNYYFGGLTTWGYHGINLIAHLAVSGLVFVFVSLILRWEQRRRRSLPDAVPWLTFFSTALFVVHPLQTSAVTYIVQRATVLTALFYMIAVVGYFLYRTEGGKRNYILAVASAVAGIFCKPTMVTLPLALLLMEGWFFRAEARKNPKRLMAVIPFGVIALMVPLLLLGWRYHTLDLRLLGGVTRETREISRWTYLLTQSHVLWTYVRLLFFPINQNLDYDYPLAHSLWAPRTGLAFTGLVLLFVFGIRLYKGDRVVSFAILWFFITLSLESSVFPISDVIFEHRLYLPMVGFALGLPLVLFKWIRPVRQGRIVMGMILGAFSVLTYQRNLLWQDRVRLLEETARHSPNKARVLINLGRAYYEAGRYDEALARYNQAVRRNPTLVEAYINRARIYAARGEDRRALADYRQVVEVDPTYGNAWSNMGVLYEKRGLYEQALVYYQRAEKEGFLSATLYFNKGNVYRQQGQYKQALKEYGRAIRLNPRYAYAYNNRGLVYERLGRDDRALKDYRQAIRIKPDYVEAWMNQGNVYARQGRFSRALACYRRALQINPQAEDVRRNQALVRRLMRRKGQP